MATLTQDRPNWISRPATYRSAPMLHMRIVVPPERTPSVINIVHLPDAARRPDSDWSSLRGSIEQLGISIGAIFAAGILTLYVQRRIFARRERDHLLALR